MKVVAVKNFLEVYPFPWSLIPLRISLFDPVTKLPAYFHEFTSLSWEMLLTLQLLQSLIKLFYLPCIALAMLCIDILPLKVLTASLQVSWGLLGRMREVASVGSFLNRIQEVWWCKGLYFCSFYCSLGEEWVTTVIKSSVKLISVYFQSAIKHGWYAVIKQRLLFLREEISRCILLLCVFFWSSNHLWKHSLLCWSWWAFRISLFVASVAATSAVITCIVSDIKWAFLNFIQVVSKLVSNRSCIVNLIFKLFILMIQKPESPPEPRVVDARYLFFNAFRFLPIQLNLLLFNQLEKVWFHRLHGLFLPLFILRLIEELLDLLRVFFAGSL